MTRIRTHTNPFRRFGAWIWQACDDHQWIPFVVIVVALVLVNSTWLN